MANTGSGQITINAKSTYGLGYRGLYGPNTLKGAPNNILPYYNRNHAEYEGGSSLSVKDGWYDMLKKYINTTSGGARVPTATDVPIYRLSRKNGDTNTDSKTYAVNYITFSNNSIKTLISNAEKL